MASEASFSLARQAAERDEEDDHEAERQDRALEGPEPDESPVLGDEVAQSDIDEIGHDQDDDRPEPLF